jgi:hypothetical protein
MEGPCLAGGVEKLLGSGVDHNGLPRSEGRYPMVFDIYLWFLQLSKVNYQQEELLF